MSKIRRVVATDVPHHVTQRGNSRQVVFDDDVDRRVYLNLLRERAEKHRSRIWAWCLMSNHIHLLAVPETVHALARAIGYAHRVYARYRNARRASCGHVWQGRYYSCPVDESGLWAVMAYIERNPVRAGLVENAEDFRWSSARAHVLGHDEVGFVQFGHWRESYTSERWLEALRIGVEDEALRERLRAATATGRPFGSQSFLEDLERRTERSLRPGKVGRKKSGIG